jgi:hypothetical protein
MLKLLYSIFGGGEHSGRYPESLVDLAIDRAVEGTDPRVRALPGYARKLRDPIVRAIDHIVDLVDSLHESLAPVAVGAASFSADPRLSAIFASTESMLDILGRDQALRDFLDEGAGRGLRPVNALLLADPMERNILGLDLVGDQVRRDVAQVTVSFVAHRLLEPNDNKEENRRLLKRRAFDFLLTLALERITEVKRERADLTRQRDLLRRKLENLERGGWSFKPSAPVHIDPAKLMAELDDITGQLDALGPEQSILEEHLAILIEVMGNPGQQVWAEPLSLYLDAMNIQREPDNAAARRIDFMQLCSCRRQRAVMLPLIIDPSHLPAREDFVDAMERYL